MTWSSLFQIRPKGRHRKFPGRLPQDGRAEVIAQRCPLRPNGVRPNSKRTAADYGPQDHLQRRGDPWVVALPGPPRIPWSLPDGVQRELLGAPAQQEVQGSFASGQHELDAAGGDLPATELLHVRQEGHQPRRLRQDQEQPQRQLFIWIPITGSIPEKFPRVSTFAGFHLAFELWRHHPAFEDEIQVVWIMNLSQSPSHRNFHDRYLKRILMWIYIFAFGPEWLGSKKDCHHNLPVNCKKQITSRIYWANIFCQNNSWN